MSTKDSDFKRKVEQAATIQLGASFLKILQAMLAAGFTDVDSKSAANQMHVRRARDAMQKLMRTNEMLAINTVTVLSRCLPAANLSVSTLTRPPSFPAGGAAVLPVLPEGVEDIFPAPPVLEKVRLTVGASIKVVRNKKKTEQWKSKALKAATLMYHTEQQKKAVDSENCVNRMSADKVEAAIKKRFSGTAGPSARSITRYVNEYKLVGVLTVRRGSPVCRRFEEEARGMGFCWSFSRG